MPKPLPEWDLPRIMVQYILKRQELADAPTLRQISTRMGKGAVYCLGTLVENDIDLITLPTNHSLIHRKIVIKNIPDDFLRKNFIPRNLLIGASTRINDIKLLYEAEKNQELEKVKKLKQENEEKIRYFLTYT